MDIRGKQREKKTHTHIPWRAINLDLKKCKMHLRGFDIDIHADSISGKKKIKWRSCIVDPVSTKHPTTQYNINKQPHLLLVFLFFFGGGDLKRRVATCFYQDPCSPFSSVSPGRTLLQGSSQQLRPVNKNMASFRFIPSPLHLSYFYLGCISSWWSLQLKSASFTLFCCCFCVHFLQ